MLALAMMAVFVPAITFGQETDIFQTPNAANAGIKKSLEFQIGEGRGNINTPDSSHFIIKRDPFRAIARGRQLFQRKFTVAQGMGPRTDDGIGDIEMELSLGAGLADSCAACHGRPRGAAGFGGDVFTRPDSRDAQHLFGLGIKEMLADEITQDLRNIRDSAINQAESLGSSVTVQLNSKGIHFGEITVNSDGNYDPSDILGVDDDLRVRPFFHHGGTISIREFVVGALNAEMGLEAVDPELSDAAAGGSFVTLAGMVLDGSQDSIESPVAANEADDPDLDGVVNEVPESLVDFLEFYLLNYFKPATYQQTRGTKSGQRIMKEIRCTKCHVQNLTISHDRRLADVETRYDRKRGIFNTMFATASTLFNEEDDNSDHPTIKTPIGGSFEVKNIYTDFKRQDLGPNFHERNFDGELRTEFFTTALWGVGTTPSYGHDGRSINLREVILRHGGEAQHSSEAFARLSKDQQTHVIEFLQSLVLFGPPGTASNLNPGDPNSPNFPQEGHGSIDLSVLFNDPTDPE
jgi:hypothetical protein